MRKSAPILIAFLLAGCTLRQAAPTPTSTPIPETTAAPAEATFEQTEVSGSPTPGVPEDEEALLLDGRFSDWDGIDALYEDPTGDGSGSGLDIGTVHVVHSEDRLLLKVTIGRVTYMQSETFLALSLSQPDGTEMTYDFGGREGTFKGVQVGHENLSLVSMPSTTSNEFEIGLRSDLFSQEQPVSIVFWDPNEGGDRAPDEGVALEYSWDHPVPAVQPIGLDRTAPDAIRIMSYNVPQDGMLDEARSDLFGRILLAVQPDILLIQESRQLAPEEYEVQVEAWLGGDWQALKQRDLVTLSRFPIQPGWGSAKTPLDVRIFPVRVHAGGTELLVFNAHMSCCDNDADRQDEADGFARYLREGTVPAGTPFILMGDLNLVGDTAQGTTLLAGDIQDESRFGPDHPPDWDGSELFDLLPRHTHSRMTYTWSDPGSSFPPSRLDYVLFTDSLLQAAGFILDTSDLPQDILDQYGLQKRDTAGASDHLPVVADFNFLTGE